MVQTKPLTVTSLPVPVTIQLGTGEARSDIGLGDLVLPVPLPEGELARQLGNLLRAAADAISTHRHGWPRQRWHRGDQVKLPGSLAHGTVVQVDVLNKHYLLDLGSRGLARVSWQQVDKPPAACLPHLAVTVEHEARRFH